RTSYRWRAGRPATSAKADGLLSFPQIDSRPLKAGHCRPVSGYTLPRIAMPVSKSLVLTVGLMAAAATLGAQRQMSATEATSLYDRATRSFADARYEDSYRQYNDVFSAVEGT